MAVQAQNASDAPLDRNYGNTSYDGSLQAKWRYFNVGQAGMLLNNSTNVGVNERKRVRENSNGCTSPELPHIQIHPQDVSTGLHLAFEDQRQKQRVRMPEQEQSIKSGDLKTLVTEQKHGINRFLHSQGEHLRRKFAEKRQRHYRALQSAAENAAAKRLEKVEAEAEQALHRNESLEARAVHLFSEVEMWHEKAMANEAAALSINAQLQKRATEININGDGVEDSESAFIDPGWMGTSMSPPVCKACGVVAATVVFLPCRHLCVCGGCNDGVRTCPLCLSRVEYSIDVIIS